MRYRIFALILFFSIVLFPNAQNIDHYSLKEVRQYRFDRLLLTSDKDIKEFYDNTNKYDFIESLKINQVSTINLALSGINRLNNIKELDLSEFNGDFNEHSFDSSLLVEILHIQLSEDRLNQIRYINSMPNLKTLYLYLNGRPENPEFFSNLLQLRELHIIGDLLPKQLEIILPALKSQRFLNTLGLSLDRVTDLPLSLTKLRTVGKLVLYDNLSVFTNKGIDDLPEQKLSMVYNISDDLMGALTVSYLSANGKLSEFESDHIQALYKAEIFSAQTAVVETVSEDPVNLDFKKDFIPDFINTPEFNAPYPVIKPEEEIFRINPSQNSVIYTENGMKISIAANSFENESGENITDYIYLRIRKFTQTSEILFAGIDMKAGSQYLNNHYMFNIQATTEKTSARLKNNFQVKVLLPVSADSALRFFYDYESRSWQDLQLYSDAFANDFIPIDFYKLEQETGHIPYYNFDTSTFYSRFNQEQNYFLNDKMNANQLLFKKGRFYSDLDRPWISNYNKSGDLQGIKIKKGKSYVKIQKVIPKTRNRERQYFKILDKTEEAVISELKAFRKINFNIIINPENKKEFNEKFIRDMKYFDLNINYEEGRDYCTILLKSSGGYKKLIAQITDTENKKIRLKQIRTFKKAYNNYLKIKSARAQSFDINNQIRFNEFRKYYSSKLNDLEKNKQTYELKIPQLGTFGLMHYVNPEFSSNLIVQYTDESGLPIDVKNLFLADSRYNTVIKVQAGNISLDPSTTLYIVATDYSGNMYYVGKNDINASNLKNNSLTYIKLKKAPGNINSIGFFNNLVRN